MCARTLSFVVGSVVVEPAGVVHQSPGNAVFHRLTESVQIGENGLNPGYNEMLLGSHAHAASDQYSYTSERGGHYRMFMIIVVAMFAISFRAECMVPGFAHVFAIGNL